MNVVAFAIGCCLLAQQPAETDPFRPRVVPGRRPPAAIEPAIAPEATAEPPEADPLTVPSAPPFGAPAADEPMPAEEPTSPPPFEPSGPVDDLEPSNATPAAPADASADAPAADDDLTPLGDAPPQRLRPPEILADALSTPDDGALAGSPLELVQALARSNDRRQQMDIAQAYWRLSSAQAAYHWARDAQDLLERFVGAQADSAAVASARAAAAADVDDAQLAVAQAQQELADLVGTMQGALPLCVDRPHVGSYNTYFEEIFGNRPAPPRIRLIHRTLPIRRKAIDAHGQAIVAAFDAVEATGDELQTGGQGLPALLAAIEQLKRQRQAFLVAVRDYNQEIAEYLFAVARPGTSDRVLVSQLILTTDRPAANAQPPAEPQQPSTQTFETPTEAGVPPTGDAASAQPTTSNYAQDVVRSVGGSGLYGALLDLNPPARVQKLSELLHWDRGTPPDSAQPTPLAECLRGVAPSNRLALVTAYWQARERAARYQACGNQVEQLDALSTAAIAAHADPGMAAAAVRLQAARRTARAEQLEGELALVYAQFSLTETAGRPLEEAWLLPATPPQSGRYVVASNVRGRARHWGDAVRLRHRELEQRADAVIRADNLRAGLSADGADAGADSAIASLSPLDRVIWAVNQQASETNAFLHALTEYNIGIAQYALATSPPGILSDELVRKLVIERTAHGEI